MEMGDEVSIEVCDLLYERPSVKVPVWALNNDDYNKLLQSGMFFEIYPEATGNLKQDRHVGRFLCYDHFESIALHECTSTFCFYRKKKLTKRTIKNIRKYILSDIAKKLYSYLTMIDCNNTYYEHSEQEDGTYSFIASFESGSYHPDEFYYENTKGFSIYGTFALRRVK